MLLRDAYRRTRSVFWVIADGVAMRKEIKVYPVKSLVPISCFDKSPSWLIFSGPCLLALCPATRRSRGLHSQVWSSRRLCNRIFTSSAEAGTRCLRRALPVAGVLRGHHQDCACRFNQAPRNLVYRALEGVRKRKDEQVRQGTAERLLLLVVGAAF